MKYRSLYVGLLLAMLVGGFISVWLGKELCWDLANYHFYNPYAFWHNRQYVDYWPSSFIHQYLNPAIDFLPYFLISHVTPLQTEFILGALHGVNFFLIFSISRCFIEGKFAYYIALLLSLLGMYGPTTLPGIGSFQNDNFVTLFILSFIKLYLSVDIPLIFAGVLLGIGLGFKLTTAIYVVGAGIATLVVPLRNMNRIKQLLLMNSGVILGYLFIAGYWMQLMWQQHLNPLFPFFNNIFHSADFANVHWRDMRFLPQTIWQKLFYPFYFSFDGRTADAPFRDFRFLIVYIMLIVVGINKIIRKSSKAIPLSTQWFIVFFISSYIVWQSYFSIARYLAALEMTAPLMIYLLAKEWLCDKSIRTAFLFFVFYLLVVLMIPIPLVRAPWYRGQFFNVQLPPRIKTSPKALVLIAYTAYVMDANPRPQNYLIPFFPPQWRFVGVPFWNENYLYDQQTTATIRTLIQSFPYDIYLLTSDHNMPTFLHVAKIFGLSPTGQCDPITSDRQVITHQGVLLCQVKR